LQGGICEKAECAYTCVAGTDYLKVLQNFFEYPFSVLEYPFLISTYAFSVSECPFSVSELAFFVFESPFPDSE
jgi:hypothetical protein